MCIVSSFFALPFLSFSFFSIYSSPRLFAPPPLSLLLCVSLDSSPWNSHWHTSSTTSSFPSRANLLPLITLLPLRPSPTHPFVPPVHTRHYHNRARIAKQPPLHLRWRGRRHHRLRRRKCRRRFHHRYYHSHTKMRLSRLCIAVFAGPVLKSFSLPQAKRSSYSTYFRLFSMTAQLHAALDDCRRWWALSEEIFPRIYRDVVPLFVGPDSMLRSLRALLYG